MKIIRDIAYTDTRNHRNKLDLYIPEGEGPLPLFIFFYGGGLENGQKEDLQALAHEFLGEGIAFAAPDYRLYPDAAYPDFIEDAAAAVAFLTKNAGSYMRVSKVLIGGYSAGAYLSMMLCFDGRYLGAHGLSPNDFAGYVHLSGQPTTHLNVLREQGIDGRKIIVDERAPMYHISGHGAPMQFIVCDDDMPARLEQNALMVQALKSFGYDSALDFQIVKGISHGEFLDAAKDGHSHFFSACQRFVKAVIAG